MYVVFDAVLLSQDDLMNSSRIMFQGNISNQNRIPVPGIRVPMRAVRQQFMREG